MSWLVAVAVVVVVWWLILGYRLVVAIQQAKKLMDELDERLRREEAGRVGPRAMPADWSPDWRPRPVRPSERGRLHEVKRP